MGYAEFNLLRETVNGYLFGSICPLSGMAHGLLLPYADLEGMRIYIHDFSRSLPADVRTLLICDQAGWHTSKRLEVPNKVTLLHCRRSLQS